MRDSMLEAKRHFVAVPATLLQDLSHAVPTALSGLAARALFRLAILPGVPFNLFISNVPGPQRPLYIAGARVEGIYPVSAVTDMTGGLNITLFSYDGHLDFGFIACREMVPDVWNLVGYLEDALAELVGADRGVVGGWSPARAVRAMASTKVRCSSSRNVMAHARDEQQLGAGDGMRGGPTARDVHHPVVEAVDHQGRDSRPCRARVRSGWATIADIWRTTPAALTPRSHVSPARSLHRGRGVGIERRADDLPEPLPTLDVGLARAGPARQQHRQRARGPASRPCAARSST